MRYGTGLHGHLAQPSLALYCSDISPSVTCGSWICIKSGNWALSPSHSSQNTVNKESEISVMATGLLMQQPKNKRVPQPFLANLSEISLKKLLKCLGCLPQNLSSATSLSPADQQWQNSPQGKVRSSLHRCFRIFYHIRIVGCFQLHWRASQPLFQLILEHRCCLKNPLVGFIHWCFLGNASSLPESSHYSEDSFILKAHL